MRKPYEPPAIREVSARDVLKLLGELAHDRDVMKKALFQAQNAAIELAKKLDDYKRRWPETEGPLSTTFVLARTEARVQVLEAALDAVLSDPLHFGRWRAEHPESACGCPLHEKVRAAAAARPVDGGIRSPEYMSGFDAGHDRALEDAANIADEQPYFPDTHTGKRQLWVKEQIAAKIRALKRGGP